MSKRDTILRDLILQHVPEDGASIGNKALLERLTAAGFAFTETDYQRAREALIAEGLLASGRGRGGSVRRAQAASVEVTVSEIEDDDEDEDDALTLEMQERPQPRAVKAGPATKAASGPRASKDDLKQVISYRYGDKRKNNPHVGMVDTTSDGVEEPNTWRYDPHIDPALNFDSARAQIENLIDDALASGDEAQMRQALEQLKRMQSPYLNWTGKAERTSFEVDTVSLHVHERIDPATILAAVQKQFKKTPSPASGRGAGVRAASAFQPDLFSAPFENLPLRDAIDFYKHERDWSNRLIAGDSLLVMNSLLQKESMAGQVQMIYLDPPYGIKYGSNFQPFVHKREVTDRRDEDLTQEPEMIKAFRDTWELGIHSYLTYLSDRLLLAKELLHESGSVFVQIADENVHFVRNLMDQVFGVENHICDLLVKKKGSQKSTMIDPVNDYLVWYGRSSRRSGKLKFNPVFVPTEIDSEVLSDYKFFDNGEGCEQEVSRARTPEGVFDYRLSPRRLLVDYPNARLYRANPLTSGGYRANQSLPFQFHGQVFNPGSGACWKATVQSPEGKTPGMTRLAMANRFVVGRGQLRFRSYLSDFGYVALSNWWDGLGGASNPVYVVQTNEQIVQRCLLMTTDPGDLVLDPTCGSGTTAFVAEKWGRRWITTDTSRVAVTLAKQRLMTASYDYYELKYPQEGLKSGFIYKTVPHVMLKSIANNPEIDEIHARLHPAVEAALAELNSALHPSPAGGRGAGGEGARTAYIPNPPARIPESLLRHAREMRKGATDAETLLWQLLRDRQVGGAKFRRQHPIGKFITDFYCDEHRLVIELDGGQHAGQKAYDEERTAFLEQQGLKVLRFWNNQVLNETDGVLQVIWEHVGGGETLTPTPLPPAGEGLKDLDESRSETLTPTPLPPAGEGLKDVGEAGESKGRKGETLTPTPLPPAGEGFKEWEVPFDFPAGWPAAARAPFDAFHAARQAMQKKMDNSIAAHADREILYDLPAVSKTKLRITGPFTVEAVPFPTVLALEEAERPTNADVAIARSGETSRQGQWRDELLKAGIRGKGGQKLKLADLEPLPQAKYIHAVGTIADTGERVAVSFGPEHAALEQRQVEIAMREAGELFPLPKMLVFCAFIFDPEAAKDIDNIKGITALKVQMNTDLLTEDLKKARASNESFWLMGQPDVEVRKLKDGAYQVEVHGFDYFDTATGELKSGGKKQIAMWALDTDYDDRSLYPKQVFFPMAGAKDGWNKLKKDIKAELNEDLLEKFHGTKSLPFEAGKNGRIAVKIVDDRGIESLKVLYLD